MDVRLVLGLLTCVALVAQSGCVCRRELAKTQEGRPLEERLDGDRFRLSRRYPILHSQFNTPEWGLWRAAELSRKHGFAHFRVESVLHSDRIEIVPAYRRQGVFHPAEEYTWCAVVFTFEMRRGPVAPADRNSFPAEGPWLAAMYKEADGRRWGDHGPLPAVVSGPLPADSPLLRPTR